MEMNAFRLDGKVALITGAVYGIGFAIAEAYAAAGAKIIFNCLNDETKNKALDSYHEKGIDAVGYVADGKSCFGDIGLSLSDSNLWPDCSCLSLCSMPLISSVYPRWYYRSSATSSIP